VTWRAARAWQQPQRACRRQARHGKQRSRFSCTHMRLPHAPDEPCPGKQNDPDLAGDAGAAAAACSPGSPPAAASAAGGVVAGASVGGACGPAAAAARWEAVGGDGDLHGRSPIC